MDVKIENFDFLTGNWKVKNRKLKERMNGCTEWIEFEGTFESKTLMNGFGNMDEMRINHFGEEFVGLSVRILNPKTNIWTIYWADTASLHNYLPEQVSGGFKNGIGEFFGKEMYQGKEYKMKFTWTMSADDIAHWNQAYYDENNQNWEINWYMDFTKVAEE